MSFLLNVTAEDIDNGIQGSCVRCPIANALARVTDKEFTVGIHSVHTDRDHELPLEAIRFIGKFDAGLPVEPFSFELNL